MSNTFNAYATKFLPVVDDIYKAGSLTEILDSKTQIDFSGTNEVKVLKVETTGLGDYSRAGGYPAGDVTATWESLSLSKERGKEISIDRMDDEELLGAVFGAVTGDFMRDWVIPEIDAYRFAKYCASTGVSKATAAALTDETIIGAIDTAVETLDQNEVPVEGRVLFLNTDLKAAFAKSISRQWGNESEINKVVDGYNNMRIVYVPKTRFYTDITLNDGSSAWGYAKSDSKGADINFMVVHPSAVLQAKKFVMPKIFTPDQNQKNDSWLFQFRLYHDAFVFSNKAKGIYVHPKNS